MEIWKIVAAAFCVLSIACDFVYGILFNKRHRLMEQMIADNFNSDFDSKLKKDNLYVCC